MPVTIDIVRISSSVYVAWCGVAWRAGRMHLSSTSWACGTVRGSRRRSNCSTLLKDAIVADGGVAWTWTNGSSVTDDEMSASDSGRTRRAGVPGLPALSYGAGSASNPLLQRTTPRRSLDVLILVIDWRSK